MRALWGSSKIEKVTKTWLTFKGSIVTTILFFHCRKGKEYIGNYCMISFGENQTIKS